MFRHPAWAVGSYSSGPPAARAVGTKSTGGFTEQMGHPVPDWQPTLRDVRKISGESRGLAEDPVALL